MAPNRFTTITIVLAICGLLAGFGIGSWLDEPATDEVPSGQVSAAQALTEIARDVAGARRPDFELEGADGQPVRARDFDGSLLVVNFWATWCPPCLEEIPMLMALQEKYAAAGVRFVGIAHDAADNVQRFLAETPLNYPTAIAEREAADLGRAFGNTVGGLPFTALVSRDGIILEARAGEMSRAELVEILDRHLRGAPKG